MPVEMKQSDEVITRWRSGIPLDTASDLLFQASRRKGSPPEISKAATVDPADSTIVEVLITSQESADVGLYYVEIEATFPNGEVITLPNDSYETLTIRPDLGFGPS